MLDFDDANGKGDNPDSFKLRYLKCFQTTRGNIDKYVWQGVATDVKWVNLPFLLIQVCKGCDRGETGLSEWLRPRFKQVFNKQ